jgi:hypothetical protein
MTNPPRVKERKFASLVNNFKGIDNLRIAMCVSVSIVQLSEMALKFTCRPVALFVSNLKRFAPSSGILQAVRLVHQKKKMVRIPYMGKNFSSLSFHVNESVFECSQN